MKLKYKIASSTVILYGLLILLHLICLLYNWDNEIMMNDSHDYFNAARNFFKHGEFYTLEWKEPLDPEFITLRPPVYPIFVYLSSLGLKSMAFTFVVQNLLSLMNIVLVAKIFELQKKVFRHNVYILLSMFFVQQYMFANLLMSEILFQTFIVLFLFFSIQYFNKRKGIDLFWSALTLVLAFLTKPVFYPLAFVFLVVGLVFVFKYKIYKHIIWLLVPIVSLFSYQYYNYVRTSYFHVSSIQATNLFKYNTQYFMIDKFGVDSANKLKEEVIEKSIFIEEYAKERQYLQDEAKKIIMANPLEYGLFHSRGIVQGLVDPGRFDIFSFFKIKTMNNHGFLYYLNKDGLGGIINYLKSIPIYWAILLLIILMLNLLKAILLIFGLMNKEAPRLAVVLGFLLIMYILLASGPLAAARFILPVSPILIAIASWYKLPFIKGSSK